MIIVVAQQHNKIKRINSNAATSEAFDTSLMAEEDICIKGLAKPTASFPVSLALCLPVRSLTGLRACTTFCTSICAAGSGSKLGACKDFPF